MVKFLIGIILGIIGFFVIKAKRHIQHKTFIFPVWWDENNMRLAYAIFTGLLIGLTIHFYPESIAALNFFGFDFDADGLENLGPVFFGAIIAASTYSPSKDKPETKTSKNVE